MSTNSRRVAKTKIVRGLPRLHPTSTITRDWSELADDDPGRAPMGAYIQPLRESPLLVNRLVRGVVAALRQGAR